ncbi:hypothetical protein D3C74_389030 [compost metagenome]
MTKVMPIAVIIRNALSMRRLSSTCVEKNPVYLKDPMANITASKPKVTKTGRYLRLRNMAVNPLFGWIFPFFPTDHHGIAE